MYYYQQVCEYRLKILEKMRTLKIKLLYTHKNDYYEIIIIEKILHNLEVQ